MPIEEGIERRNPQLVFLDARTYSPLERSVNQHVGGPMAKRNSKRSKKNKKTTTARRTKARAARAPSKVSWLARGYPLMSPVAVLEDCVRAIDWYKSVFGAKERLRLDLPGGAVAHCELGFGASVLMLGSPMPPDFPPKSAGLSIYVKNCDAVYQKALSAGARSLQEPMDQFYGDRNARFEDPFGNEWNVMTHIKNVSEREMKRVMAAMGGE
jgi:PhnB protein